jgi:formylglycine-generating enzyme
MSRAALLAVLGIAACRTPTQVTVEITTDLSCDEHPDTTAQVGLIGANLEERPVAIATTSCGASGRIGSFVVVPSGGIEDEFAVKVILGHGGRSAARCREDEQGSNTLPGCIFARRGLRFLPHTELDLPILMRGDCDGIVCPELATTCVHGSCVGAIIRDPGVCHGAGCQDNILGKADGGSVMEGGGTEGGMSEGGDGDARESGPADADASQPSDACTGQGCVPPSCTTPLTCGTLGESCCTSLLVTGDSFLRRNDMAYPATVSSFRLDKFETTVGRFRTFVAATSSGWLPPAGSGKHVHLSKGGLYRINDLTVETGWDPQWNAHLPQAKTVWDNTLDCNNTTWTPAPGANEHRPMVCVSWYDAYAFCIWDGGFLPSYAEWNFATAGGREQRRYAWGDSTPDLMHASYCGTTCGPILNVGSLPLGNGRYGQADLGGNAYEWLLDSTPLVTEANCQDCLVFDPIATDRGSVGGGYDSSSANLVSDLLGSDAPDYRDQSNGFRCARPP